VPVDRTLVIGFLFATLTLSAPLLLAALGELVGEKAGVLNIALEGQMLTGAWAGATAGYFAHNAGLGLLAAAGAGCLMAAVFGVLVLVNRADAVVVGTGLNLFALGLTGTLNRAFAARFGAFDSPTLPEWFFI
jgi:simple sugar transport system permease protein